MVAPDPHEQQPQFGPAFESLTKKLIGRDTVKPAKQLGATKSGLSEVVEGAGHAVGAALGTVQKVATHTVPALTLTVSKSKEHLGYTAGALVGGLQSARGMLGAR